VQSRMRRRLSHVNVRQAGTIFCVASHTEPALADPSSVRVQGNFAESTNLPRHVLAWHVATQASVVSVEALDNSICCHTRAAANNVRS
jgi:hypothetical protein